MPYFLIHGMGKYSIAEKKDQVSKDIGDVGGSHEENEKKENLDYSNISRLGFADCFKLCIIHIL